MATALQNFREQYPQYNDMDDEALAEGLRKRHYSDMDPADFRRSIGLPPPPVEPEPPGIWDRVKSAFTSEQEKPEAILSDKPAMADEFADPVEPDPPPPSGAVKWSPQGLTGYVDDIRETAEGAAPVVKPEPTLTDQLVAGWYDYRANRATADAFDTIEDYRLVEDVAMGKREPRGAAGGPMGISPGSISKFARANRAELGDPRAQRQIQREISGQRQELTNLMQGAIDRRNEFSSRAAEIPYSESTQDMLQAEGFSQGIRKFADDPIMIMAEISLRSLPT